MPRSKEVDAWFARYDNPMKAVVQRLRGAMLAADPRIDECIKWQAPTFTYRGNIASFFPKSKQHASLMFHQGALIPGRHAVLEGDGETSRVLKASSVEEVDAKANEIRALVLAWCAWRDDAAPSPAKSDPVKKAGTKSVKKAGASSAKKKTSKVAKKTTSRPAKRKTSEPAQKKTSRASSKRGGSSTAAKSTGR